MSIPRSAHYELLATESVDLLGEGPWWSTATDYLYWVDIKGHYIRGARLDGSDEIAIPTPSDIGFAVPTDKTDVIVGLRDGVHRFEPNSRSYVRLTTADYPTTTHRINDGKTDRQGRLWYGTMHDDETEPTGAMYGFDGKQNRRMHEAVTTSNGLGWSPDNEVFYYTDSMARTITAFDFDAQAGEISHPRVFSFDDSDYRPDGLTVDAEGFVWSAKWNGGLVVRYAPDGRAVSQLALPVSRPTSCMFVGPGLTTLAVTSAQPRNGLNEPLAGRVFLINAGVAGLPEVPFNG